VTSRTWTVHGTPVPQGSHRIAGRVGQRGRIVDANDHLGPWRARIAWTCRTSESARYTGPVAVTLTFRVPAPKRRPRRQVWPAKKPDLDKLCRAVFDGLTDAGVWADDALPCRLAAEKVYATDIDPPGVTITVTPIDPPASDSVGESVA
jgi:Holliday junction resolvase RusA-like endonuclease